MFPLSSNILFLTIFHNHFLWHENTPSSYYCLNLLLSFLVTLLFSQPISHPSACLSGTFPCSRLRTIRDHLSTLIRVLLFWSAGVHQRRLQSSPSISRALPAPQQSLAMLINSTHLFVLSPKWLFSTTPQPGVGVCSHPSWAPTLSWHPHVFPVSSTPHTAVLCSRPHTNPNDASWLPLFVFTKNELFFRLRFELFTSVALLHHTVKAGCTLQGRVNLFSLFG